jgi:plastocyanin
VAEKTKDQILHDHNDDGVDRSTFLKCIPLTAAEGTTVQWVNRDDIPQTFVSTDDARLFKSKVLDTDESFSYPFAKPGSYSHFCSVHLRVTGKEIVP